MDIYALSFPWLLGFAALAFYFGACIGSFLNVVILRLPREQKLSGRSHCPHCGRTLQAAELFPLFSFLFLGGRCRHCKQPISWRYFTIEAAVGILYLASFLFIRPETGFGLFLLIKLWFIMAICVVTFVVDLEHYVILSRLVLSSALLVLAMDLAADLFARHPLFSLHSLFLSALAGGVAGALPIWLLWYASKWRNGETGRWMGFGDVQLMFFLGASLGLRLTGLALFLGIILGGIISIALLALTSKTLKSRVPFGAFLIPAAIITVFFGGPILRWYLALLGV